MTSDQEIIGTVLGKLNGVRKHAGYWMARCPAHDDKQASLSISTGKDQPVILNCHAGCDTADILAAISLTTASISKPRSRNQASRHGTITATYPYTDEHGQLLFEVCRTDLKQFPQRRPDPATPGGWRWGLGSTRRVLYHLPQILEAVTAGREVWIAEGEKDVHALEAAGVTATCNPGGAGKWRDEYAAVLTGAAVVIIADKDEPGRAHATAIAASLKDRARLVITVEAAEGKDASDHIAAGHSLAEFIPQGAPPPPVPAPADPAGLLHDVAKFLARFIAYPSDDAHIAHTLWIAHTHFMDAWESTPRIAFLSPEPGSGKTRALEVSELLVPNPVEAINTTPAYLFRKVADPAGLPVILYDEIDTLFGPKAKDNEEIRGLLNAGHRRGAVAGRCVTRGKIVETEELPAYCAVALAGIGDLPDTLLSRAAVIRMRRRAPGETVEPFRRRTAKDDGHHLRDQLAAWAAATLPTMNGFWPDMPEGIADRDADVWEAMLAVADAAGGDWPQRARVSAVTLVTDSKAASPSLGIKLLSDLRDVFGNADVMSTEAILEALKALEESPWCDLKGKPLSPRGLAHRLRQYNVKSMTVRIGDVTAKGYRREDLHDPWSRYLLPVHIPTGGIPQTEDEGDGTTSQPELGVPAYRSDTSVTTGTGTCHVCGYPLDPKLATAGETTHPMCDPVVPDVSHNPSGVTDHGDPS